MTSNKSCNSGGARVEDYFNFGFIEEIWLWYCGHHEYIRKAADLFHPAWAVSYLGNSRVDVHNQPSPSTAKPNGKAGKLGLKETGRLRKRGWAPNWVR